MILSLCFYDPGTVSQHECCAVLPSHSSHSSLLTHSTVDQSTLSPDCRDSLGWESLVLFSSMRITYGPASGRGVEDQGWKEEKNAVLWVILKWFGIYCKQPWCTEIIDYFCIVYITNSLLKLRPTLYYEYLFELVKRFEIYIIFNEIYPKDRKKAHLTTSI